MAPPHRPANLPKKKDVIKREVANETDSPSVMTQKRSSRKQSLCSVYSMKEFSKQNEKSQHATAKSRNCLDVVDQSSLSVGIRNTIRPKSDSRKTEKKGNNQCDVAFIRQLLAINKKQELLLNKRLAELLRDEPETPLIGTVMKNKSPEEHYPYSTVTVSDPDHHTPQSVVNNHSSSKNGISLKPRTRVDYDLNGRRVYREENDDYNDSVGANVTDDGQENQIELSENSETWFKTTTLIQAKSDMSCNLNNVSGMAAQRNSLTVMNQQSMCKVRPRERCVSLCSGRGAPSQRTRYTGGSQPTGQDTVFCRRVLGDGVQNVIAHCCQVDLKRSGSQKRVQKVWNYQDIPKTQSDGSASEIGRTVDSHGDVPADTQPAKLKSTIPPIRNIRPSRS